MRPSSLDEVVGQEHIVGRDKLLYRAIKGGQADLCYFLRASRNRQDYPGPGDRQHYER